MQVLHGHQVQPTLAGRDLRDARRPDPVGGPGLERPIHEVLGHVATVIRACFGFSAFDTGRITPREKAIVMTLIFIASHPACRNREGTHSQSLVEKETMG
jgi:hypothetical protein